LNSWHAVPPSSGLEHANKIVPPQLHGPQIPAPHWPPAFVQDTAVPAVELPERHDWNPLATPLLTTLARTRHTAPESHSFAGLQ